MAGLRDLLNAPNKNLSGDELEQISANGMGSLRRGWESGRLGNAANYKLAEEAALRASATPQDLARATTLRGEVEGLQRKQAIYAPEVGRVEDIDGFGSGASWLGSQIGQGAASMADPIVASTLAAGAGNLISAVPHPVAKAVGLGLRTVGTYGLPYAINQRQLKGEFYDSARRDDLLMASHTPQEINDTANQYGALAAIPDSAIPGLVGSKLGLSGLRAGRMPVPGLRRVGGELLTEGTTELGQEAGKQFALGQLNPERDTSGDFSANLNAFAGGVAGAGGPVVAGHVVDTAARRVAGGAQAVKETAGKVIDMAAPHVQPLMDKAVTAGKAVRGGVIDLAEAAKGAYEEKGLGGLKDELKAAGQAAKSRWTMNSEERDLLAGMPPPEFDPSTNPEGFAAWHAENGPKRVQAIMDRLDDRFGEGDEQAGALGDKLAGAQDPIAQGAAADEAAQYLMDNTELEQLGRRAERFSEAAGEVAGKAGAAAGKALGAAGRLAARFGKAAIQGVKNSKPAEGEGSKKNAQSWTQEQYDAETAKRKAAADDILGRAKLMGQYLSKSSETSQQMQGLAPKQRSAIAGLLKDLGYEISDLSDLANSQQTQAAKPTGKAKQGSGLNRQTVSGDALTTGVNRVVNNLRAAYGRQTPEVLQNLRAMAPHAKGLFDAMDAELEAQQQDRSGSYTASIRAAAAEKILAELPPETEAKLLAEDINIRSPEAKRKVLGMVEAVALGRVTPAVRGVLERLLGKDVVQRMAAHLAPDINPVNDHELLAAHEVAGTGYEVSEDGDVGEPTSSKFEQEGAERKVARGTGTTMYGFHATKEPRSNVTAYGRARDPFDYTTKMSRAELAEFRETNLARMADGEDPLPDTRKRPNLFTAGQTLHDGGDAVAKKIADLEKHLKVDRTPARMAAMLEQEGKKAAAQKVRQAMAEPDNAKAQAWLQDMLPAFFENRAGGWNVSAKSASEVLGEVDTPRLLTLFRDYLRQDGDKERAAIVHRALLDALDQKRGVDQELRLTAGQRRKILNAAKAYFAERQVVVAEQLSDRDPLSIDEAQLLDMAKQGAKVVDAARKDGGNARIDEANILTFKAAEGDKLLHIPVSRLADLAGQAREQSEAFDAEDTGRSYSNASKDEQYLRDVMTGVSVLLGSGLVDGLPYKTNAMGRREQMSRADGLPPSLQLRTKTVGEMNYGKGKRAQERRPDPKHNPYGSETSELLERDEVAPLLAGETVEDEVAEDTRTPIDAQGKPKGGKSETGQLDEFAAQRMRSRTQGYDPTVGMPHEYKIDAMKKAADRGATLTLQMAKDFEAGMAAAERRLSVAKAVDFSTDKAVTVGGPHYIAPLVHALSEESLARLDLSPAEAKRAVALRAKVAEFLKSTDYKPAASLLKLLPASVKEAEAPAGKSQPLPAGAAQGKGRKLNAQAVDIHRDLGRSGFAATHDSPIRHEGKFDWRSHSGKGEGNAAFGAGTYLSTSDGVHRSYKEQFTAQSGERRSFTWGAVVFSVDSETGDILADGDTGMSPAEHAVAYRILTEGMSPKEALYQATARVYDAVRHSGDQIGDLIDVNADASEVPELIAAARQLIAKLNDLQHLEPEDTKHFGRYIDRDRWNRMLTAAGKKEAELKQLDISGIKTSPFALAPTYQVSVDIAPDHLLNWNKPLSEQSEFVQEALEGELRWKPQKRWSGETSINLVVGDTAFGDPIWAPDSNRYGKYLAASSPLDNGTQFATLDEAKAYVRSRVEHGVALTGEYVYKGLVQRLGSQAKASDYLQSLGILGHRYNASAGKNDTHPNYVIYDDSKITTNYVHFNQQAGAAPGQPSTMAERAEAIEYIKKTLGPEIKVQFEDITGYSGEWIEAENVIKISTTSAAGTQQTAYHEALHAFFSRFVAKNPRAKDVLRSLAENPRLLARLEALLRDYPSAVAQLQDGEERLAYAYQFWAAGQLELPHAKARNLFQKLAKFFRKVLGRVTDSERATAVFEALHAGEFGGDLSSAGKALQKVLDQGTWTPRMVRKMDGLTQKIAALILPANSILEQSASPTAKRLATMFWTNPGQAEAGSANEGYLNARARNGTRFGNLALAAIKDLSAKDLNEVMTKLQEEKDNLHEIAYQPAREAAEKIRALLQRFRVYMVDERGMNIGDRGPFYFPRTWNPDAVAADLDGFTKLMTSKYADMLNGDTSQEKEQSARRLARALIDGDVIDGKRAVQRDDGVLSPFFSQSEARVLAWMKGEDVQKYMRKDLVGALNNYFHNGARAAEYTARFGQDGTLLADMLEDIRDDLKAEAKRLVERGDLKDRAAGLKWAERQERDVRNAVAAMEGSIGKDGSLTMRKVNSWVTVYQNVRLLPVALFAQVADTMGVVARGGTVSDAYESFLRGMKEVGASWADLFRDEPKERQIDKWEKLALAVGTVDAAMFSHHVSEEYSSTFMNSTARKVNDTFFRLNGMEAWNRGMRVGATKSAAQFLQRHKSLPNEHSVRWLKELGLSPADIVLDADGELVTNWRERAALSGEGEQAARANNERIHYALNRWVQGAVLTPNAAMRPAWSSDPSYSMFFHLKQFSYAFHQTILKRAVKEMDHGNMAPMGSFLWYVPVMIATDIVKGLALNGGELPAHMKSMNVGDWMMHGAERTGMLGVGAIGVDAQHDIASIGGPAVEQVIDAFKDDFGATTLNALPANPLYKNLVKAG